MFGSTNPLPRLLRFQILTDFSPIHNNGSRPTIKEKSTVLSQTSLLSILHVLCWKNSSQSSGMCVLLAFVEAEAADVCIRVHIGNPSTEI